MGGLIYGFLVGMSIIDKISLQRKSRTETCCAKYMRPLRKLLSCAVLLVLLKMPTLRLLQSDGITSPCPSCKYTSCVSFPPWNDEYNKWWYCDDCGQTTADASFSEYGYYDTLLLNCPDEVQTQIDISSFFFDDMSIIQEMLPSFCRENCENVFK